MTRKSIFTINSEFHIPISEFHFIPSFQYSDIPIVSEAN